MEGHPENSSSGNNLDLAGPLLRENFSRCFAPRKSLLARMVRVLRDDFAFKLEVTLCTRGDDSATELKHKTRSEKSNCRLERSEQLMLDQGHLMKEVPWKANTLVESLFHAESFLQAEAGSHK